MTSSICIFLTKCVHSRGSASVNDSSFPKLQLHTLPINIVRSPKSSRAWGWPAPQVRGSAQCCEAYRLSVNQLQSSTHAITREPLALDAIVVLSYSHMQVRVGTSTPGFPLVWGRRHVPASYHIWCRARCMMGLWCLLEG